MNFPLVDEIVEALLYEGHTLYPYRSGGKPAGPGTGLKLGCLYPDTFSRHHNGAQPFFMQSEFLVELPETSAGLQASVRFLHPMVREVVLLKEAGPVAAFEAPLRPLDCALGAGEGLLPLAHLPEQRLVAGLGSSPTAWQIVEASQEAVERRVDLPWFTLESSRLLKREVRFQFPQTLAMEPMVRDGMLVGWIQRRQEAINGTIEILAQPAGPQLVKATARVLNHTWVPPIDPNEPDPVGLQTMAATHTILSVRGGEFISLVTPRPRYRSAAKLCRNIGSWPVLVGNEQLRERHTLLSSPVMLCDYPQIASQDSSLPLLRTHTQITGFSANKPGDFQTRRHPLLSPAGLSSRPCGALASRGRGKTAKSVNRR